MAVLKKGSKGAEVRKLQEALNKAKVKPMLKVDGDFGKNTEAAVRDFQKRARIKVDGKVGAETWAALKNNGPLPEMKVPDQSERLKKIETARRHNMSAATDYTVMWVAADSLSRVLAKQVPIANKAVADNQQAYDVAIKNCKSMIKMQADFEKLRLSDPKKATALAQAAEKLFKENEALNTGTFQPNIKRLGAAVTKMKNSILKKTALLQSMVQQIEKRSKA